MDLIHFLIDFILHIDVHLAELVAQYGVWVYAILFLILFCETGLVVTPFLPGDSLLFVAGALSALPTNDLNVHLMVLLMVIAAIVGDAVNYTIGRLFGEKLFREVAIKWSAAPDMTPQTVLYRRPVAQFSNFQPKIVSSWLILALFQANFLISGRSRLCPYQLVNSNQVRQGE